MLDRILSGDEAVRDGALGFLFGGTVVARYRLLDSRLYERRS